MQPRPITMVLIALLAAGLTLGACRREEGSPAPSASTVALAPPPAGFARVEVDGWSLDVPPTFVANQDESADPSMVWLVHQKSSAPGSPRLLFARYAKPADFSSQVYGLSALDNLRKTPDKRIVASRQHVVNGLEVTDIEVVVGDAPTALRQWRRLFVHGGLAYALTYSVAAAEGEQHRAQAATVLGSLRAPLPPPSP